MGINCLVWNGLHPQIILAEALRRDDFDYYIYWIHIWFRHFKEQNAYLQEIPMNKGALKEEMDNVIDLESARKLLHATAGGEPPMGENWLKTLSPGTIFLSRPKQKGGSNKQAYCDQFCVAEHKEVSTNLLQKMPTGQQIDIWYPSLEFSRNNDYVETIAQVKFGYSEEQLKIDSELPEEEGEKNDGNNGDGGRAV